MPNKCLVSVVAVLVGFFTLMSGCSAGVLPPATLTVATVGSSFNSHAINHAIAAPYLATAPLAAYSVASPAAYAYPYAAYYNPYNPAAPYVAYRR
ncbi:uncharacterized protein LOC111643019 [Copidosoma floridanum]|uniref:uncharacterized protein LOC111643019 n=1 Tax=Copidosoma floridanum TaxID=29053 RepID=UPI000C6F7B8F|nr:uncharacterized protein LOC111643019 [Copidosoma floridanum]